VVDRAFEVHPIGPVHLRVRELHTAMAVWRDWHYSWSRVTGAGSTVILIALPLPADRRIDQEQCLLILPVMMVRWRMEDTTDYNEFLSRR
jgi:hypothetical protein